MPSQGKRRFVPLPGDCIVATFLLESWTGLGTNTYMFTKLCQFDAIRICKDLHVHVDAADVYIHVHCKQHIQHNV